MEVNNPAQASWADCAGYRAREAIANRRWARRVSHVAWSSFSLGGGRKDQGKETGLPFAEINILFEGNLSGFVCIFWSKERRFKKQTQRNVRQREEGWPHESSVSYGMVCQFTSTMNAK